MDEVCTDGRFDLIERVKEKLVEATNIETSPEEMAVLDSILFRMWQMGWLDRLKQQPASQWHRVEEPPKEDGKYLVYMLTSDWRWEFKFAGYLHGRWIGAGGGDVCYWMPIEPPKEENDGN